MLTDTRQALLDAIRDNPDDDAPRLIYADWLDENGDPARATFIRLQCEEARLPEWDARRTDLNRAAKALQLKHQKRWQVGMPRWARGEYRRGFVQQLHMSGAMFQRSMAEIWKIEPVTIVSFGGPAPETAAALQQPLAAEMRGLRLWGNVGNEGAVIQALLDSPHVTELRSLHFDLSPGQAYPTKTLNGLQAWHLPKLRHLHVSYAVPCSDQIVEPIQLALCRSTVLQTVEDAMLLYNRTPAVADAFTKAPTKNLRKLWLTAESHERWLDVLMHSKRLSALRSLSMPGCVAPEATLRDFFASTLLGRLTELAVHVSDWSNRTVSDLVNSPRVKQLEVLQLDHNSNLDDRLATAFVNTPYLKKLRHLSLTSTQITAKAAQQIRHALPHCCVAH